MPNVCAVLVQVCVLKQSAVILLVTLVPEAFPLSFIHLCLLMYVSCLLLFLLFSLFCFLSFSSIILFSLTNVKKMLGTYVSNPSFIIYFDSLEIPLLHNRKQIKPKGKGRC